MSSGRLGYVGERGCQSCERPVDIASRWNGLAYVTVAVEDDGEGGWLALAACPHCGQGAPFLASAAAAELRP